MNITNSGYLNVASTALMEYCHNYNDDCDNCPFRKCERGCPATLKDDLINMILEANEDEEE